MKVDRLASKVRTMRGPDLSQRLVNSAAALVAVTLWTGSSAADDLSLPGGTISPLSGATSISSGGIRRTPSLSGSASYSFTTTRSWSPTDRLVTAVQGVVDLNSDQPSFICNAAGVITAPMTTNTGNHPGETASGLNVQIQRYGAVVIGNATLGFFNLFNATAEEGLGSPTPPTLLARCATFAEIFDYPGFTGIPAGTTLELRVADTPLSDNTGVFTVIADSRGVIIRGAPTARSVCPGITVQFSAIAGGTGPFTFRWAKNQVPLSLQDFPTAASSELVLNSVTVAMSGDYSCTVNGRCGSSTSLPARLVVGCDSIANIVTVGGITTCDDQLTADDIIAFLAAFFSNQPIADVASIGGTLGADGRHTPDDVIVFLAAFFAGCP